MSQKKTCNTHTMYQSIKVNIPIIMIYNTCIPHYDATKKSDIEQTFI